MTCSRPRAVECPTFNGKHQTPWNIGSAAILRGRVFEIGKPYNPACQRLTTMLDIQRRRHDAFIRFSSSCRDDFDLLTRVLHANGHVVPLLGLTTTAHVSTADINLQDTGGRGRPIADWLSWNQTGDHCVTHFLFEYSVMSLCRP